MFITRTISGAVLLVVIFSAMIFGGPVWLVMTALLSVIALFELYKVFGFEKYMEKQKQKTVTNYKSIRIY